MPSADQEQESPPAESDFQIGEAGGAVLVATYMTFEEKVYPVGESQFRLLGHWGQLSTFFLTFGVALLSIAATYALSWSYGESGESGASGKTECPVGLLIVLAVIGAALVISGAWYYVKRGSEIKYIKKHSKICPQARSVDGLR